jgi:hypothetical protein
VVAFSKAFPRTEVRFLSWSNTTFVPQLCWPVSNAIEILV